MGGKTPDYQGAFCCSSCHDAIDGRGSIGDRKWEDVKLMFDDGVFRTQEILRRMGLIKIEGE
jgi:hypothetical protein